MTRFVIDSTAAIHIARERISVPSKYELLAPTLLRSQTLSALHEAVDRGELESEEARDLLDRVGPPGMKIRLLGDAVLRRKAWAVADRMGWIDTYTAEYVALTMLQADAFVTLDADLARTLEGVVETASIDALRRGPAAGRTRSPDR